MKSIVFFDLEVSQKEEIQDIGAISQESQFHDSSTRKFIDYIAKYDYLCGHNIFHHDLKYVNKIYKTKKMYVDTLFMSPLLFPQKPYHHLLKDDKFYVDELNNPLNDSKKAMELFMDECQAFKQLEKPLQEIFYLLLKDQKEFHGFFHYLGFNTQNDDLSNLIQKYFKDKICYHVKFNRLIKDHPIELAYALAIINHIGDSITPAWVYRNYPNVENILHALTNQPCLESCPYCNSKLDEFAALKDFFGYPQFREFNGEALQQKAIRAAIENKSLLAIFPTGGGKSLTFQLPAFIAGRNESGLTVVISPLQSLMKDQVDSLENKGITKAVTINGSLDPIERSKAIERIEDGSAQILYIAPESLRSKTVETLLLKRNVVRFVIDEAHCFSSWGQDFRVDYLYIGDFIKSLQEQKINQKSIPVSCFTATAKPAVVEDIRKYFKQKLSIDLLLFSASAERKNLQYHVFSQQNDAQKYENLRNLLTNNHKPTIIYASRTKDCEEISRRLNEEGYSSTFYHGKLEREVRITNQNAFMNGDVEIIVATTAFGMGVDKSDVTTVIHYDISDSLENYVQEAGRAGRDEQLNADCYVLFNEDDLNKHFQLLNRSKLSMKEIQQVWKAIKDLTRIRKTISQSALEIARQAGWDEGVYQLETKVITAINALEQTGYLKRKQNQPRIFADSLTVKSVMEANQKIDQSSVFENDKTNAKRVIQRLVSSKYTSDEGEGRIDYIADQLGIPVGEVTSIVLKLKEAGIIQQFKDLHAFLKKSDTEQKFMSYLQKYQVIEDHLLNTITQTGMLVNLKKVNADLEIHDIHISINDIKQIINYLDIMKVLSRKSSEKKNCYYLCWNEPVENLRVMFQKRINLAISILEYMQEKAKNQTNDQNQEELQIDFSFEDIKQYFEHNLINGPVDYKTIESSLFYLKKIGCIRLEGAFLVMYNAMQIERVGDNKLRYKKEDYDQLAKYYEGKVQQIHIVGEYAKKMITNYQEALQFVNDYFTMTYDFFINKYFKGRKDNLTRTLTPEKFRQIFGELSPNQMKIVNDKVSKYIVVAAGPGSGKTRLLVHKLASLFLMEDVKQEQMLMLTFSRSAAVEFKKRLLNLIGTSAHYIQITTFHSYCFDLLEKIGTLDKSNDVISDAVHKINNGEVDISRITKTVLVVDEAQDMSEQEFMLIEALIQHNEDMRVIAVGDDDQNIYEFRGSSSQYLKELVTKYDAKQYELLENYRSVSNIVEFSNQFIRQIKSRLKRNPVEAFGKNSGIVRLYKYSDTSILVPVVNKTIAETIEGTVGVLTKTNEDVYNLNTLFIKNGYSTKILQNNNELKIWNLAEIRFFDSQLIKGENEITIDEETWNTAIFLLKNQYSQSSYLEGILKLLNDYKTTNSKMYYSEFKQFIMESKQEDLYESTSKEITISTIHQAKGREFDNVILVLSQKNESLKDEEVRTLYVAITRAKKNLYIHDIGKTFDHIKVSSMGIYQDGNTYEAPNEITIALTHKDVALGSFEYKQKYLEPLYSGLAISVTSDGCSYYDRIILRYSNSFNKRILELETKGYKPVDAVVNSILYWYDKDKEKEYKIVLPIVRFIKE